MNILNFEGEVVESLDELIAKQKEIMIAFEPELEKRIEEFDIDIYEDQMLLKDFLLTRAVEEITEAYSAISQNHIEHYLEELVDVFNFLIEAHILTGFDFQTERFNKLINYYYPCLNPCYGYLSKNSRNGRIKKELFEIVQSIGEVTNTLKQRPWRQSQYPVDMMTFKTKWERMFLIFFAMLNNQEISISELFTIWSKKYQVNKFRIESRY